jgi:hypothetical protein
VLELEALELEAPELEVLELESLELEAPELEALELEVLEVEAASGASFPSGREPRRPGSIIRQRRSPFSSKPFGLGRSRGYDRKKA